MKTYDRFAEAKIVPGRRSSVVDSLWLKTFQLFRVCFVEPYLCSPSTPLDAKSYASLPQNESRSDAVNIRTRRATDNMTRQMENFPSPPSSPLRSAPDSPGPDSSESDSNTSASTHSGKSQSDSLAFGSLAPVLRGGRRIDVREQRSYEVHKLQKLKSHPHSSGAQTQPNSPYMPSRLLLTFHMVFFEERLQGWKGKRRRIALSVFSFVGASPISLADPFRLPALSQTA